jgi:hypothetical protein
LRGLLNVRERHEVIDVGNVADLIEACDRIPHVLGIGQRFFPLLRKSECGVRQIAFRSQVTMPFMGLPRWLCGFRCDPSPGV